MAYFHAVEFSLANKLSRFLKGEETFQPGTNRAVTHASWLSLIVREKFLFIDILRFALLRRRLERTGYEYLLSDRSFLDSIINLQYLSRNTWFLSWPIQWGIRFLTYCAPKAERSFYFDLTPEVIMARAHAPEQGPDYLRDKIQLFKEKIGPWHLTVIDASKDAASVAQAISEQI